MDKIELKEKWYARNVTLIVLLLISAVIPFLAIIIIPLVIAKSKQVKQGKALVNNKIDELNLHFSEIIKAATAQANDTIADADNKANGIIADAKAEYKALCNKIEEKQAFINKTRQEVLSEAQAELEATTAKLTYMNAEIDKKQFYLDEVTIIKTELEKLDKKMSSKQEKIDHLMSIQKSINHAIKTYFSEDFYINEHELTLPSSLIKEIDTLAPAITLKLHAMDYKDLRRAFRANEKLIDGTLKRYEDRYTTKTNRAIYQLMVIALRAELQNVLYTLTYSKLNEASNAIKDIINKYLNIARTGSQTISSTLARFIGELEPHFLDAVKIEYNYYVKKEAAHQEQLELRAQMREEAEERKRLKEQQEQMEKEEQKYTSEIQNIQEQIKVSQDDEKTTQLLDKIKELESQLNTLSNKKGEIINLQNGKAGYVYIISNLGSFGGDVFKVGMTRRLNPQERVDELGDASVPFKFDVHSFIFSANAVQLESDLHVALEANRLNKVNPRKEFFKIPLDDIEALVDKCDPTAEFNRTMIAEQYHQSLSLAEESESA